MASPKQRLLNALTGSGAERKLLAPFLCAAAAETAGMTVHEFLLNPTKLANTLRDLQRSLDLDVLVPETGYVPEWAPSRRTVLLETLKRLKQMVGDRALLAVAIRGPLKRSAESGGEIDADEAARLVLENTREVCEHGADLVWISEDGERTPEDADEYAAFMAPIWGTIRFYQAVPALHLRGTADGWLDVIRDGLEGILPCIDPVRSPALGQALAGGAYGVILSVDLDPPPEEAVRFVRDKGCVLVTSDVDWEGRVPARDFQARIHNWRTLIQS